MNGTGWMMRVATMMTLLVPALSGAQGDTTRSGSVARAAVEVYNAANTQRVSGAHAVPAGTTSDGSVAVLNGPVTVAGHVRGSLVAINADVTLLPGAQIDRDVIVVGGALTGRDSARIGGEIRRQDELLRYHLEEARVVADQEPVYDDSWWRRHNRVKHDVRRAEAFTDFFYVASRAYNRVEGWSVVVGPRFQRNPSWGKINVEAFGVVRSADPVVWGNQTLGHDARAEFQLGRRAAIQLSARAFDVVEPTETWQLSAGEVGLASAILHRDYRDYYTRHGGEGAIKLIAAPEADITVAFSDEQWGDRRARDPWTLFRGNDAWRENPVMDVGGIHLLTTRLRVDTRERTGSAWSGWFVNAEVERGNGTLTRFGAPRLTLAVPRPEGVTYARAFVDLRRYTRLSPDVWLNLRAVGGGWMSGDELPTQRKLSVGGLGTIPGFEFRQRGMTPDVLQCSNGLVQSGTPGQCDRIALLQAELRSSFLFGGFRDDSDDDWWRPGFNHRMQWVLFGDAGRGWRVGTPDGSTTYSKDRMPSFNSFKTDIGFGLDLGGLGLYWAKALGDDGDPARFFVRLERRF
jgi:hypothetical protein